MQMMGLEPTRAFAHMTLNHACLPIPTHLPHLNNRPTNRKRHVCRSITSAYNNNKLMIASISADVKMKRERKSGKI